MSSIDPKNPIQPTIKSSPTGPFNFSTPSPVEKKTSQVAQPVLHKDNTPSPRAIHASMSFNSDPIEQIQTTAAQAQVAPPRLAKGEVNKRFKEEVKPRLQEIFEGEELPKISISEKRSLLTYFDKLSERDFADMMNTGNHIFLNYPGLFLDLAETDFTSLERNKLGVHLENLLGEPLTDLMKAQVDQIYNDHNELAIIAVFIDQKSRDNPLQIGNGEILKSLLTARSDFRREVLPLLSIFGKNFIKRKNLELPLDIQFYMVHKSKEPDGKAEMAALLRKAPDLFLQNPRVFSELLQSDYDDKAVLNGISNLLNEDLSNYSRKLVKTIMLLEGGIGLLDAISKQGNSVSINEVIAQFYPIAEQNKRFTSLQDDLLFLGRPFKMKDIMKSDFLTPFEKLTIQTVLEASKDVSHVENLLLFEEQLNIPMLRGLINMGINLSAQKFSKSTPDIVHNSKKRGEYGVPFFTVTSDGNIFVSTEYLNHGTYKSANGMVCVTNPALDMVRFKLDRSTRAETNAELHILNEVSASLNPGEKSYLIPPFYAKDLSSYKKDILIGQRYTGDGNDLQNIPLEQKIAVFSDVSKGLGQMHRAGYVHHDFKPANFLYKLGPSQDTSISAVVHDFGLSHKSGAESTKGTWWYAPPEGDGIVLPSYDAWALSKVIYHLSDTTGRVVFALKKYADDMEKLPPESTAQDIIKVAETLHTEMKKALSLTAISMNDKDKEILRISLGIADDLGRIDPSERITLDEATARFDRLLAQV